MKKFQNQKTGGNAALGLLLLAGLFAFNYQKTGELPFMGKVKEVETVVEEKAAPVVANPTYAIALNDTNAYRTQDFKDVLGVVQKGQSFSIIQTKKKENTGEIYAVEIRANGLSAWVKAVDLELK